jgi:acrylyl-CoA reductase (NADPH)
MIEPFKAFVLAREGRPPPSDVHAIYPDDLPAGDVIVDVEYSSLNYKDALAVTGRGRVIRAPFPFVPGIDLAGTVLESESDAWSPGDRVLCTGWGLGETRWGGFTARQRLPSNMLMPVPPPLATVDAMTFGTAGLTAMLAMMSLEEHQLAPDAGEVLVSGASGGVGSLAVALLALRGYRVVASSGKQDVHGFLRELGAHEVIPREALSGGPSRPLESARWVGAIDTVGGDTLASIVASLRTHGCVAACGNAGGHHLNTTVFPFILRGVNLLGIDSNTCPNELRADAWSRLAASLPAEMLERIRQVIPLRRVPEMSETLLAGRVRGRIVVDVRSG